MAKPIISTELRTKWLKAQVTRLIGAFWQLRTGGEFAAEEYMHNIEQLSVQFGMTRVEEMIGRIIKGCADLPAIAELGQYIPPVGDFRRCAACAASEGFVLEEKQSVHGYKYMAARKCRHEAA